MSVTTSTRPQLCTFARSEWTGKCHPHKVSAVYFWEARMNRYLSIITFTRPPQLCATKGCHWTGKCLLSPSHSQDFLKCVLVPVTRLTWLRVVERSGLTGRWGTVSRSLTIDVWSCVESQTAQNQHQTIISYAQKHHQTISYAQKQHQKIITILY